MTWWQIVLAVVVGLVVFNALLVGYLYVLSMFDRAHAALDEVEAHGVVDLEHERELRRRHSAAAGGETRNGRRESR